MKWNQNSFFGLFLLAALGVLAGIILPFDSNQIEIGVWILFMIVLLSLLFKRSLPLIVSLALLVLSLSYDRFVDLEERHARHQEWVDAQAGVLREWTLQITEHPTHEEDQILVMGRLLDEDYPAAINLALYLPPDLKVQRYDYVRLKGKIRSIRHLKNDYGFDSVAFSKRRNQYGSISIAHPYMVYSWRGEVYGFHQKILQARADLDERLQELLGPRAKGFVYAVAFGQKAYLTDALKARFREMGLAHILALSGFHLAVLASLFGFIGGQIYRWLFLRPQISIRTVQAVFALFGVGLFALWANLPISASRAFFFVLFGFLLLRLRRHVSGFQILWMFGFLSLLYRPDWALDVSMQLSFLAVFGIFLSIHISKKRKSQSRRFKALRSYFSICWFAFLMTSPILAFHFHEWSVLTPFANLFFVPILGVLGTGGVMIATLVTSLFPSLIGVVWPILGNTLEQFFVLFETPVKLSSFVFVVPRASLWAFGFFIFALILASVREKAERKFFLLISLFFLSIFIFLRSHLVQSGVYFMDVGQGDASLIIEEDGRAILIDAGGGGKYQKDVGRSVLVPFLKAKGVKKIEDFFITHDDADHLGGAIAVLEQVHVGRLWVPEGGKSELFLDLLNVAYRMGVETQDHRFLRASWKRNEWEVQFYPASRGGKWNDNDRSLVIKMSKNGASFLFTGDIEISRENQLLSDFSDELRAEFLKIPHHGSKTSSSLPFLRAVRPKVGIVSVGEKNRFGHPAPVVLKRLKDEKIEAFRTDWCGQIRLFLKEKQWNLSTYQKC